MTVIRPNSIAGITSITAQENSIIVFKSDGTTGGLQIEGAVINSTSGISTFSALNLSAGSASAPSISFNDNNTGIYSPGADQLALSTNGTERLFIDANGRIGVGVTPSSIADGYGVVHVAGTNGGGINFGPTTGPVGYAAGSASGVEIGTIGTTAFSIFTNNQTRATVTSAGNVGINTSTGSALLQVNGTFRAGDQATSGMSGNNETILLATPPSGALAAEIHCFGKDYSTSEANNHTGLLVAYWSADTNTINTTTNVDHSAGANQGFEVIWSSPNLIVRNKTSMSANQSARAWIRWLA